MLVKEIEVRYGKNLVKVDGRKVTSPEEAASVLRSLVNGRPKEVFGILLLDARNRVIGAHEVSVGTLTASLVHPREVFRAAILQNSHAIILGHNHPSGDCTPSKEDDSVTRRLKSAGELLGIRVLDHIIVTETDHFSYSTTGRL